MTKAHLIRSAVVPRFSLAALILAATLIAPHAQEAAAPQSNITVDPRAVVDSMPKQGTLLTGLYATEATLEICNVVVTEPALTAMSAHRRQLENDLRLDEASGKTAYETVKADVEKTGVDCAEGSADRKQADAVVAIYSGKPQ